MLYRYRANVEVCFNILLVLGLVFIGYISIVYHNILHTLAAAETADIIVK